MAATSGSADDATRAQEAAASPEAAAHEAAPPEAAAGHVTELRWRHVFPGDVRQIRALRRWLAVLLPACPARDDAVTVAAELATNAVKFTASGRGGRFAVEITWCGRALRVAVADGGAPAGPRLIDDPMSDCGRGLLMVRALSARTGVCGDQRGRLVWAEISWTDENAAALGLSRDAYEAAIREEQAALAQRFPGVVTWFGRSTLQWWAMPSRARHSGLLTAPSAEELADQLDRMLSARHGPRDMMATEHGTAQAREWARAGPALSWIRRNRPHPPELEAQAS